jgi:signal transduction histidine kinase
LKRLTTIGDVALALATTAIGVAGTAAARYYTAVDPDLDMVPGVVLAGGLGLVLVVRRTSPIVTLAVSTALITTYLYMNYPYGPVWLGYTIAVYTAARHLPFTRAVIATAVSWAVMVGHIFVNTASLPGLWGFIPATAWVLMPFAIGVVIRTTREATQRTRAEMVRERVADERLRVAQEVHDVVGHGLAAIKMQADIALHLLAKKPEQAEIALNAISRTSTAALDELRATLTVVRGKDRAPSPGLDQLPELQDRMTSAGMDLDVDVTGENRKLPAAVDFAAYRVLQESLTNVLRHSQVKQASVVVAYENSRVVITIANPAATVVTNGHSGLGIPGMRERVTSLGGTFSADADTGRFEVRAEIPT